MRARPKRRTAASGVPDRSPPYRTSASPGVRAIAGEGEDSCGWTVRWSYYEPLLRLSALRIIATIFS
jgi:hypothetical protein